MRIRVTNESKQEGLCWVDAPERDDDDRELRPPKLHPVAAGAAIELHISQRGMLLTSGFKARIVSVPKRKPEKPSQTKARGNSPKGSS